MRRGERRRGEKEVAGEGGGEAKKRERGEEGSRTEHLIHGLCSAPAAGKECFKLNCHIGSKPACGPGGQGLARISPDTSGFSSILAAADGASHSPGTEVLPVTA